MQIDSMYNTMEVFPQMMLEITVNCDGKGRVARKLKETQDKAAEIAKYLAYRNQVPIERYKVSGVGAADPISSNVSDEGRAKNTRIAMKRVR
jgi:outer membrane protein OmpA-like peptidoglycan-associated protein